MSKGEGGLKTQFEWRKNIKCSLQELVEKKNTLKHFELQVDRDGIKGGSCEDSCSGQMLAPSTVFHFFPKSLLDLEVSPPWRRKGCYVLPCSLWYRFCICMFVNIYANKKC